MRKISLVLIFAMLLSCIAPFSVASAGNAETITLLAPAFENGGNPAGEGFSYYGEYAWSWELGTQLCSQASTTTASFTFNVETAGKYGVYMKAAADRAKYSCKINDAEAFSGDWDTGSEMTFDKRMLGSFVFPAGSTKLEIECNTLDSARLSILYLNSVELVLESSGFAAEKITAEGADLLAGENALASTDVIKVKFESKLKTVTEENVTLTENGTKIPAAVAVDEDTVLINLKQSLTAGGECNLKLENIYDSLGVLTCTPVDLTFNVGSTYSENAKITLTEDELTNGVVTAKGNVLSSADIGIGGRSVKLFKAENTNDAIAETISGDEGAYVLSYEIPAKTATGMQNFVVKTVYSSESIEFSKLYVDDDFEETFLNTLYEKTSATGVKEYMETEANELALGIDVSEDLKGITDSESVFVPFVGVKQESASKVVQRYYKRIAMSKLVEASEESINSLLSDGAFCKTLGVDADKYKSIIDKEALVAKIADLNAENDEESFTAALAALINAALPPEVTVNYSESFTKSENVSSYMSETTPACGLVGTEFVRFPVTLTESGKYDIYLITAGTEATNSVCVQTSLEQTKETEISAAGGALDDINSYGAQYVRGELLGKGTHYFKITNVSGAVGIRAIRLVMTESGTCYDMYAPTSYNGTPEGATVSGVYWVYYDDGTDIVGGTTVNFEVDVLKAGFYDLYLTAASNQAGVDINVAVNSNKNYSLNWATASHQVLKKELIGRFALNTGKTNIKVTCLGSDANVILINSAKLVLAGGSLTVDEVTADGANLSGGETADVSADVISVKLSADIDTESISGAVTLESDGKNIPVELSASGNTLFAALKKSLTANTGYTLKVSGVKDADGIFTVAPFEMKFKAGENYTENASLNISENDVKYGNVTVSGTVLSSAGIGISGRRVMLYKAGNTGTVLAEGVSGENGAYTVNYTMPSDSKLGLHSFVVKTEFSNAECGFDGVFVTEDAEKVFFEEFKKNKTASDVKSYLAKAENEEIMSIDVSADTAGISDTGSVFSGLLTVKSENIKALRDRYYARIAMVKLAEAQTAEQAEQLINSADIVDALEIDTDKVNDITTERTAFINKVMALKIQDDEEDYKNSLAKLVNEYVLLKYGKSDEKITAQDQSVYVGQVVDIELEAENTLEGVLKIVLDITADGASFDYTAPLNVTAKTESIEGGIRVTFMPQNSVKSLGTVTFNAEDKGSYTLKAVGTAEYTNNLSYTLKSELLEKTITVSVSENKATGGGGGGGSAKSGALGGISASEKKQAFEFTDIADVSWAETAIKYLLANNIISKPDDALFRPNDNVKREEIVKMIVMATGTLDSTVKTTLLDVFEGEWYYPYVASAEKQGIVTGDDSGKFNIGSDVTRQDIAVMINRMLSLAGFETETSGEELFADDCEISEYAKESVYRMRKIGVINGVGDNLFAPRATATRAQAAKMIYEMMKAVGK